MGKLPKRVLIPAKNVTCLRCGITWATYQEHPRVCPYCFSAYWDVPRKTSQGVANAPKAG